MIESSSQAQTPNSIYLVSNKNCLDKDETDSCMDMQMRTQLSLVSSGMLISWRKRDATDSSASAGHSVNQSEAPNVSVANAISLPLTDIHHDMESETYKKHL